MDSNNKIPPDERTSQVFIISPQELAELGILNPLTDKCDTKAKVSTNSIIKNETRQLLRNIFKPKKSSGNSTEDPFFKNPTDPSISKEYKEGAGISNEHERNKISEEIAICSAFLPNAKGSQDPSTTSRMKAKHSIKKPSPNPRTDSKKVSIISNTLINFKMEELNNIVGQTSNNFSQKSKFLGTIASKPTNTFSNTLATKFNVKHFSKNYSRKRTMIKNQTSKIKHTETNAANSRPEDFHADLIKDTSILNLERSKNTDDTQETRDYFNTDTSDSVIMYPDINISSTKQSSIENILKNESTKESQKLGRNIQLLNVDSNKSAFRTNKRKSDKSEEEFVDKTLKTNNELVTNSDGLAKITLVGNVNSQSKYIPRLPKKEKTLKESTELDTNNLDSLQTVSPVQNKFDKISEISTSNAVSSEELQIGRKQSLLVATNKSLEKSILKRAGHFKKISNIIVQKKADDLIESIQNQSNAKELENLNKTSKEIFSLKQINSLPNSSNSTSIAAMQMSMAVPNEKGRWKEGSKIEVNTQNKNTSLNLLEDNCSDIHQNILPNLSKYSVQNIEPSKPIIVSEPIKFNKHAEEEKAVIINTDSVDNKIKLERKIDTCQNIDSKGLANLLKSSLDHFLQSQPSNDLPLVQDSTANKIKEKISNNDEDAKLSNMEKELPDSKQRIRRSRIPWRNKLKPSVIKQKNISEQKWRNPERIDVANNVQNSKNIDESLQTEITTKIERNISHIKLEETTENNSSINTAKVDLEPPLKKIKTRIWEMGRISALTDEKINKSLANSEMETNPTEKCLNEYNLISKFSLGDSNLLDLTHQKVEHAHKKLLDEVITQNISTPNNLLRHPGLSETEIIPKKKRGRPPNLQSSSLLKENIESLKGDDHYLNRSLIGETMELIDGTQKVEDNHNKRLDQNITQNVAITDNAINSSNLPETGTNSTERCIINESNLSSNLPKRKRGRPRKVQSSSLLKENVESIERDDQHSDRSLLGETSRLDLIHEIQKVEDHHNKLLNQNITQNVAITDNALNSSNLPETGTNSTERCIINESNLNSNLPKKKRGRPRKVKPSPLFKENVESFTRENYNSDIKVKDEIQHEPLDETVTDKAMLGRIIDYVNSAKDINERDSEYSKQTTETPIIKQIESGSNSEDIQSTEHNIQNSSITSGNNMSFEVLDNVNSLDNTLISEESPHQNLKKKRGRKPNNKQMENVLDEKIPNTKCMPPISSLDDEYKTTLQIEAIPENEDNSELLEKGGKKKYRQTGTYAKMVSSVSSAATALQFQNTDRSSNASTSHPSPRMGRPKKDAEHFFNIDTEGKVTCASCKEKIMVDDWYDHNEIKHNNLSWRDGESIINLDQQAVKDKLKSLLSKNKTLVCLKCKEKYTKFVAFIFHSEECNGIVVNGQVTCAICFDNMSRESWPNHKMRHNNLAWRVGDTPLDLNNETFVFQTLTALYKAKKPLYCKKCDAVKKSVLGLLSHMAQCGNAEDPKVACGICGKKVLPVSMPSHIKAIHETPKKVSRESNYFDVELNSSQVKRKAATKAIAKMDEITLGISESSKHFVKQMDFKNNDKLIMELNKELVDNLQLTCKLKGCDFVCEDTSILLSHLTTCPLKPDEYYSCTICFFTEPSEGDIIKHIQTMHGIKVKEDLDYVYNEHDDNYDNEEMEFIRIKKSKNQISNDTTKAKPLFILNTSRTASDQRSILYSHAFEFTYHFCQKNFKDKVLFENLKSDWYLIEDLLEKYLPTSELSCDVTIKKLERMQNIYQEEHIFKKYEVFEVEQGNDHITIYCGGPVFCQAWTPTTHTSLNQPQILAVATGKDFDGKYFHNENYSESTVIQFWNFGLLKNCESWPKPRLEFCLGIENGPIWHLEWCPSGCYNVIESDTFSRIGLLAVAGSSMSVDIYSIPLMKEEQRGLFYKTKPVLQLKLVMDEKSLKRKIFSTKISWSKVSGHNYVAVGYSDGSVALYDLTTTSSLMKFTDNLHSDVLLPYKTIKTHCHFISAIAFIPIDKGNRWLLTSSFDKTVYIWDLHNDNKFFVKKSKMIVDAAWLTNWLSYVVTNDESTSTGQVLGTTNSYREYMHDFCHRTYSLSTISTISVSDWLNGFIQGNETGEINAFFPHQMLYDMGKIRKSNYYSFLRGFTILIDKNVSAKERATLESKKKTPLRLTKRNRESMTNSKNELVYEWYEPFKYKEATQQYGVVFCDSNISHKNVQSEDMEFSKPNLYPLQAINKICFNPNRQASLYYATGYQIGFIRLNYLKLLENDRQIYKSGTS